MKKRKPLVILGEKIKSPPFSAEARLEAGVLLGMLQEGLPVSMPQARTMPSIGRRCLELRIKDENAEWRILCRVDPDLILLVHAFSKKPEQTPKNVIELCKQRLKRYDSLTGGN